MIFVHAGIVNGLIHELQLSGSSDFETIDIAIRMWLIGLLKQRLIKNIINSSSVSMFWTRILGSIPVNVPFDDSRCITHIGNVLNLFKVDNIIVGHTPSLVIHADGINGTCDNKVWRVDVGSSKAFDTFDNIFKTTGKRDHSRRPQVLEIIDDKYFYLLDRDVDNKIKKTKLK